MTKKGIPVKGKAIVAQSGGCTAVINQSVCGVIDGARHSKAITHLWGSRFGVTGVLKGDFVDLKRQPSSLVRGVANLPSAALGSTRYKLGEGEEFQIIENLRKWGVRYLFLVGGNDTAQTVLKIAKASEKENYYLRVIHIPKTIDNDLMETDHTPGYGSAARFAALTTQEADLDTQAMRHVDPVKIIELMGRNSGWIVAASALLKKTEKDAPHLLLLPEVPFEEGKFLKDVEGVLTKVGSCIVVISETIRDKDGVRMGTRKEGIIRDSFGHPYVEGAANHLARLVEERLKVRARFDKPGTIQRMSIPYVSVTDQEEAFLAGRHAVEWAVTGISRVMVSFVRVSGKKYKIRYVPVPLEKIPDRERYLPASFLNAAKNNVTPEFQRYALPLIGGKLPGFFSFKSISPKL